MAEIRNTTNEKVTLTVTEHERSVLADGILSLIQGAVSAKALICHEECIASLNDAIEEYQVLLKKIVEDTEDF